MPYFISVIPIYLFLLSSYDESLWTRFDLGKRHVASGVLDIIFQRGVSVLRLAMCEVNFCFVIQTMYVCI